MQHMGDDGSRVSEHDVGGSSGESVTPRSRCLTGERRGASVAQSRPQRLRRQSLQEAKSTRNHRSRVGELTTHVDAAGSAGKQLMPVLALFRGKARLAALIQGAMKHARKAAGPIRVRWPSALVEVMGDPRSPTQHRFAGPLSGLKPVKTASTCGVRRDIVEKGLTGNASTLSAA